MPDNPQYIVGLEFGSRAGTQTAIIQHFSQRVTTGSLVDYLIKQFAHPCCFFLIDGKVHNRLIPLVATSLIFQLVSVAHKSAGIMTAGNNLPDSIACSDGSFLGLPCRLLETDVVHQLIAVGFDFLLALMGTPHFDAVLDKPFQHKRRFTFDSSEAVKHIHQQNVEFTVSRIFF